MKKFKIILLALSVVLGMQLLSAPQAQARKLKYSLSTNGVQWINFGTINLEGAIGLSQHFSLHVGGRYNPFEFKQFKTGTHIWNKQITGYVGSRWWPWYVFSGWWVGLQAQYSQYEVTGIWRPALNTGSLVGAGLSFGYNFMLSEHWNIDLGLGFWGGYKLKYNLYCCPNCMDLRDSGPRPFICPNDISISVSYVF